MDLRSIIPIALIACSSCSMQVFQAKVPRAVVKSAAHLETERVASDYLARKVSFEHQKVASSLSHSLGSPNKSSDNNEKIAENLNNQISKNRSNQDALNKTLNQYQGKEIEGTGIDIGKGMTWTTIALFIVGIVAFPSVITILFYLLRQSRSALSAIVQGVETFKHHDKQHGNELKECLSASMDKQHKKLVERIR